MKQDGEYYIDEEQEELLSQQKDYWELFIGN